MKLKFLGTGGGRYVTGEQKRRTAGVVVKTEKTQLHIDPGPGALVYSNQELDNPEETEAVLVSHNHPDHSNDVNCIIEQITEINDFPGTVIGNQTAMEGYSDIDKVVSRYHKNLCVNFEIMGEQDSYTFKDLEIETQEMFHSDPKTIGFTLEDEDNKIGFWTDTDYSDELTVFYDDCDTLVVYCTHPRGEDFKGHTHLSDIPSIAEETDASTILITHFGYKFLESDLDEQKQWLEDEISQKVIFATDNMEYPGDRSLADF
ncbi:MAG: ribonuclease BN (tRNA processing enzyme) [Candidatus Nanohaloarchaea archaeon]|jgi:ribonuclease BN (tRNA processing enzyme)